MWILTYLVLTCIPDISLLLYLKPNWAYTHFLVILLDFNSSNLIVISNFFGFL